MPPALRACLIAGLPDCLARPCSLGLPEVSQPYVVGHHQAYATLARRHLSAALALSRQHPAHPPVIAKKWQNLDSRVRNHNN